jgi:hypothetical protein
MRRITLWWMFLVFPVVFWAESPSTRGRTSDCAPDSSPRVTIRHKLAPIREYLRRSNREPDFHLVASGTRFSTSAPRMFPPIIMVSQLRVACVRQQILPGFGWDPAKRNSVYRTGFFHP